MSDSTGLRLAPAIRMALSRGRRVSHGVDQHGDEYVEFVDWMNPGDFNCEVGKPRNARRRVGRVYRTGPRANFHLWCVACDKPTHTVFESIDPDEARAY